MDGIGMWQFIDSWVQNCKSWDSPVRSTAQHDRAIVKSDGDDEVIRGALKHIFPHLSKIKLPDTNKNLHLTRKTFSIDETSIQALQRKILSIDLKRVSNPSKFVSLVAHTWICLTRTRATTSNEPMSATSSLFFAIDLRSHLNAPINEPYIGNCIGPGFAQAPCSDLLSPNGLSLASSIIENVISTRKNELLKGWLEVYGKFRSVPIDTTIVVVVSPRFRPYEMDFGFGRPNRAEHLLGNLGKIALLAGREPGSIQMSVSVSQDQFLEVFADLFVTSLVNL